MTRSGEVVQIKIPRNSLAFQIGETAQILSGGLLKATPHRVMAGNPGEGISRNTLAVFFPPGLDVKMNSPRAEAGVFKENLNVPGLEGRWAQGMTFEEFETNTFRQFYEF